jgi:lipopolysaccharide export system permease protein
MFPHIITRYVVGELLRIFVISLLAFVGLMLLAGVAQEALQKGLPPDIVLQVIPFILPKALMFAMPATILFSICCVFGRMSADNEVVAVKALGVPTTVMIFPAILIAFILSLVSVWLNDVAFAWSYWGAERVVLENTERIAYAILNNKGHFKSDKFSINVQGVDGERLIQPTIIVQNSENRTVRIMAKEARLASDPENHGMVCTLRDGTIVIDNQATMSFANSIEQSIPLKSAKEIARAKGNPDHLYMHQIPTAIHAQKDEIRQMVNRYSSLVATRLIFGDHFALCEEGWTQRRKELSEAQSRLRRLHVVPHRRWANGFSCLAFAMVGIPLAIRLRSANYVTTFGICFLPILLTYYPMFMVGMDCAKSGSLPPYATWFANLICIAAGFWMMSNELKR